MVEEAETEERWYRSRPRKRTLLFLLLFSILAGSLLYYTLPAILYSLRIDVIPSGAYVVPWMQPTSSFEQLRFDELANGTFDIDAAMADALELNMTFTIKMWDNTTRIIPSTIYLGHDSQHMYIGGKFVGMYSNPASDPNDSEPESFSIYFDVANTGVLKTPESGSRIGVNIAVPQDTLSIWQYTDMLWVYDPTTYRHMMWMPTDNYPNRGLVPGSQKDYACCYENSNGTVTILLSRFLRVDNTNINAFQMRHGERWVMGFLLELQYQGLDFKVDGWPQKTFGIWSNDSSWWPKLVIDLTNPPKTIIPGQPTSGVKS